jgi:hypothetical protein
MADTVQSMDFNPRTPIVVTNESNLGDIMVIVGAVVLAVIVILLVVVIWRYFFVAKGSIYVPEDIRYEPPEDWVRQDRRSGVDTKSRAEKLLTFCDEYAASLNNAAAEVDAYAEKKENMTAGIRHTPTEDMLWASTYM